MPPKVNRLSKAISDSLPGRVKPTPPKKGKVNFAEEALESVVPNAKRGKYSTNSLERTPQNGDLVQLSAQTNTSATTRPIRKEHKKVERTKLGDIFVAHHKTLADQFSNDLERVALDVSEARYSHNVNQNNTKQLPSILLKLEDRADMFVERGLSGIIRDFARGTMFLSQADKNYPKIVKAMEKRGYKVALAFVEDAQGNLKLSPKGKPLMEPDIDIRFGKNAQPSGYQDIQMRFEKGGNLFELLILPGPNYAAFKNREHELVYENFRTYKNYKFIDENDSAKAIVKAMKEEFFSLTRKLYPEAALVDEKGIGSGKVITFTKENIKTIDSYLKGLKNLLEGRFNSLPPSKRSKPKFNQTETYKKLDLVESKLRETIDIYKPRED